MKLGIDLDGVIADFTTAYGKLLIKTSGRNLLPDGWDIPDNPNWPTTWYWERTAGYTKAEEDAAWKIITSATIPFWQDLQPLPGAVAAVGRLNELHYESHDVYFLTHRFGKNAKAQTEHFLLCCGYENPTVVLGQNKDELINAIGINFFIDDKPDTVAKVAGACKMKHLYLKDAPYNREDLGWEKAGVKRVGSIQAALEDAGLWDSRQ